MERPKRVAVIGYDGASVPNLRKYADEGLLPSFKKVFDGGTSADECLVPFPTITPPNWTTLATGANLGTHGVTDFSMTINSKTPDANSLGAIFDTKHVQAETIWEALDREGKKAIVLNWPTSWPSRMKNGIVIGGAELAPIVAMTGVGLDSVVSLCDSQVVTTSKKPMAIVGQWEAAQGWANVDKLGDKPLEMAFALAFPKSDDKPASLTWYLLARNLGGAGYDTVTLAASKDLAKAYCTLKVGEWSAKIWETFKMADGRQRKAFFKVKLMELSPDAGKLGLFITPLCDQTVLASPKGIADKLESPNGIPLLGGFTEFQLGLIDLDTFSDNLESYSEYLGDLAVALLKDGDWDGFFMHSHPPDITYHAISAVLDPDLNKDDVSRKAAWAAELRMNQGCDKMLGRIMEVLPKDVLVVLVSDHSLLTEGSVWEPFPALAEGGLAVLPDGPLDYSKLWDYERMLTCMGNQPVKYDPKQTQAVSGGCCHIWIKLKGRDPEGIVEPEDYEKVQQQIIDAMLTYVDPRSGKRPVALALAKEDARILGLYGEHCGDVVWAAYPWATRLNHGPILPTAKYGIGDMRGLWAFYGPGVKKGQRLQRTVGLEDIVPTICHLTGLPLPKNVDGAVVNQVYKDPDFIRKDAAKMRDGLARMEAAMARKTRQPWDKHDCA